MASIPKLLCRSARHLNQALFRGTQPHSKAWQINRASLSCAVTGNCRFYCSSTITEPTGNYRYSESHEWALLEGTTATVGISNYAQDKLGEAVFVDMPELGGEVTAGEEFGAVESVKAAADLYSPLSGTVSELNAVLQDEPSTINSDPYGTGWIMKIEVSNSSEYDKLMSQDEYKKFLSENS